MLARARLAAWGARLFCFVALVPVVAAADEGAGTPGISPFDPPFEWSAPAGCPSRATVLASLSQLLDLEPASWDQIDHVRGRVSEKSGGWELELEFQHGEQTLRRQFSSRDCADLAQAAAASLGLVLDPSWDWTQQPAPARDVLPPTSNAPDRTSEAQPAQPLRATSTGQIALALGVDGMLDATTFGRGALGIGVLGRAKFAVLWSVELFGTWLPDRRIALPAGEAVELGLLAGGTRGCWWAQPALAFCAEFELGRLSATGVGLEEGRPSRDLWAAPGPSVVLSSTVFGSLSLNARVAVLMPLVRPHYFVDRTDPVQDVPSYALRVALGAAFPVF